MPDDKPDDARRLGLYARWFEGYLMRKLRISGRK
jgi:hypothetical protein